MDRQYALEATRQSIIGYKSWQQVSREFRDNLRAEGITGFRDAAGREWNMKTYADMVARTTTMEAHLIGTANRLLEHGHDLVKISQHAGACEKCRPWEGRILSLTGKTTGYPTLEQAREAGLFHPRCRHAYGVHLDIDAEIEQLERELGEEPAGVSQSGPGGDAGPGKGVPPLSRDVPVKGISEAAKAGVSDAMSRALAHGRRTQTECLLTLDAVTGQPVYNQVNGVADRVQIPLELMERLLQAAAQSIVSVHNHSNSASFGEVDLRFLGGYPSLKGLVVAGHDGTNYYIGRTPDTGALDRRALVLDWHKYITKHHAHYLGLVKSGELTEGQAWKEHTHQAVQDLVRVHRLEYVRWSQQ